MHVAVMTASRGFLFFSMWIIGNVLFIPKNSLGAKKFLLIKWGFFHCDPYVWTFLVSLNKKHKSSSNNWQSWLLEKASVTKHWKINLL